MGQAGGCTVTQGQPNGGPPQATNLAQNVITLGQAQALAAQLAPYIPGLVPLDRSNDPGFPLTYSPGCGSGKYYSLQVPAPAGSVGNAPSFLIADPGSILQIMQTQPGPLRASGGVLYWGNTVLFNLPSFVAPPTSQVLWSPQVASGALAPVPGQSYETMQQAVAQSAPAAPAPVAAVASGSPAAPAGGEPAYAYQTSGGAAASSFDFSSIPWWAWAGAAAVGLYLVTK
jgi:hypothetical protein